MEKYFLDTNIFLRVLIKEGNRVFKDCYQLLERVKTNQIKAATANIALAEIAWTLHSYYQFPKGEVVQAIKGILNLRGLRIIDSYEPFWAIEKFRQHNIKYIDALIASILIRQKSKWVIVSYDKDFDKIGVKRKEPEEIINL